MDKKERFYWIRLNTDFFNEEKIDFLLSQKNGCEYVVLYQMLCLKTANTSGMLQSEFGEIIVPFDTQKIVRDTKYFDFDTVAVALELFKKLGLIYEMQDGVLAITDHMKMVGSECVSKEALKKREQRARKKLLELQQSEEVIDSQLNNELKVSGNVGDTLGDNLGDNSRDKIKDNVRDNSRDILGDKMGTNCPIEIRDKRLEIRDKSIESNRESVYLNNYGQYKHVFLSKKSHNALTSAYGSNVTEEYIRRLDEYLEVNKTKKYDNHFLVIKRWIDEDQAKPQVKKASKTRVMPKYHTQQSVNVTKSRQELINELNKELAMEGDKA